MRWMRALEAAEYCHLSTKTIYTMVKRGSLRAARIGSGRNLLFADQLLDEDLAQLVDTPRATRGLKLDGPGTATARPIHRAVPGVSGHALHQSSHI